MLIDVDYNFLYVQIMEPHAVPQNVTAFQFKLVGDMTLKQFIYLASGVATGYLTFLLIIPKYPIFGWPIVVVSVLLGVAFAFLPYRGRPLDQWVKSFFIAIYSPTKRIWSKNGRSYKDDSLFNSRFVVFTTGIQQMPAGQPSSPAPVQIIKPQQIVNQPALQPPSFMKPVPPPQGPTTPLPSLEELKKTVELAREAQGLKLKIIQTEKALNEIKSAASKPSPIPVDYTHEADKIITDLKNLVTHASNVKHQLDQLTHTEEFKPFSQDAVNPPKVVRITPFPKPKQQLALTTFPNVINGIVRDRLGNYLEGCISVIYDKEGLPVRALKTNKLGQFSGSTPLPNGVYTLELEKDNFSFDVLQMELTGQVLPPLMITAKEAVAS